MTRAAESIDDGKDLLDRLVRLRGRRVLRSRDPRDNGSGQDHSESAEGAWARE